MIRKISYAALIAGALVASGPALAGHWGHHGGGWGHHGGGWGRHGGWGHHGGWAWGRRGWHGGYGWGGVGLYGAPGASCWRWWYGRWVWAC